MQSIDLMETYAHWTSKVQVSEKEERLNVAIK